MSDSFEPEADGVALNSMSHPMTLEEMFKHVWRSPATVNWYRRYKRALIRYAREAE